MILYVVTAIWPLAIGYLYDNGYLINQRGRANRNVWLLVAMLPMFLLIGLRNTSLGADTGVYINNFLYVAENPMDMVLDYSEMEVGYLYFVKLITLFTKEPLVYQLICTAIYACGTFSLVKSMKEWGFECIFFITTLGLFTFMFTGIRQCLAMSLCLISYQYAVKRKLLPFAFWVALACCFHTSAALFAVVYFIVPRAVKWYNFLLYAIFAIIAGVYLPEIQNWFNDALDVDYGIEEAGGGVLFLLLLAMYVAFSIYVLYVAEQINDVSRPLINLSIISLFFWILRLQTRVAERPSYYFLFFACALIPYALNHIKHGRPRFSFKVLTMGAALALYIYRFSTNFTTLVPYQFYSW